MTIADLKEPMAGHCCDCPAKFIGRPIDFATWIELHSQLNPEHQIVIEEEKK